MRIVGAVAAILRRLRGEKGAVALLFLLVAVTSFVVAASPRVFDRVADEGLRYELAAATAVQRNLQFSAVGQVQSQEGDPFARVRARGDALWGRLPGTVQDVIGERGFAVDSTRFSLADPPNFTTKVTFGYQDGIEDQIEIVEGRLPGRAAQVGGDAPPRFEVAMSTATAETIHVGVGDTLAAGIDPSDPMLRRVFPRPTTPIEIDVVGLFRVVDPTAAFWFDDGRMAQAAIGGSEDDPIAFAMALVAPEAYQDVRDLGVPAAYRWRFHVDTGLVDAGRLDALVPDLRRLESAFGSTTGAPGDVVYRTGLLEIADRYLARRATTEATLAIAALGPLAVAAGAVGLVSIIIVRRRRPALILARGRGASSGQLLAAQLWEGLLITVPAALLGLLLASVAVTARSNPMSAIGAILVALAATALLLAATWPFARRARRDLEREDAPGRGVSPRRLVLEATIIGVALAAAWLLRERSVTGEVPEGDVAGFDPFLAATPVLIGIAVGLLAIRLYPFPVRALAAVSARRRDLVPVLGLRSIGRHPSAAYLPLLVLTLTVAIGVFSSVVAMTIERGQLAVSWQEVGADHRIEAPPGSSLPDGLDVAGIDGVTSVAAGMSISVPPSVGTAGSATPTLLHAIEPAAYEAVVAGTPAAVLLPPAMHVEPTDPAIGTPDAPIPALVSSRLPNGWAPRGVGDTFELQVHGRPVAFAIAGISDTFPGIRRGATFIVASFEAVAAAHDEGRIRPTVLFARGPAEVGPQIEAMLADTAGLETRASRHESFAALHDAPLVLAVGSGFLVALAVAAAYAALAVVAIVALDAQRRARELGFLRTLGLTDRQLVGLTVVEHAPPVVLALGIGVALGLGIAWLLEPGLELAIFIDPAVPVVLSVDWPSIGAVVLAVVVVVAAAVGASSWAAHRLNPAQALRMGDG